MDLACLGWGVVRSQPGWARPHSSSLAAQSFFKPRNALPCEEPEDCTSESGIKGQGDKSLGPRGRTWKRAERSFYVYGLQNARCAIW